MYIFVYGTLKRGFPSHYLLKNSIFIDYALTQKKFVMYSNGSYPLIIPDEVHEKSGFVKGEVYKVNENILKILDEFEDVPEEYVREKAEVLLLNKKRIISAFLYISSKKPTHLKVIEPDEDGIVEWRL